MALSTNLALCIHIWLSLQGVLTDVQQFYGIGDGDSGLLQAIFVVGFMATSPVFGYCGDRYNRKWLMVGGIGLWSAVTLGGSFIPKDVYQTTSSVADFLVVWIQFLSLVYFAALLAVCHTQRVCWHWRSELFDNRADLDIGHVCQGETVHYVNDILFRHPSRKVCSMY